MLFMFHALLLNTNRWSLGYRKTNVVTRTQWVWPAPICSFSILDTYPHDLKHKRLIVVSIGLYCEEVIFLFGLELNINLIIDNYVALGRVDEAAKG